MDRWLSSLLCLKRFRADKAVGVMSAGSIVIHFDVLLEYGLPYFLAGSESFAVNGLQLERVEETLSAGMS